MAAVSDSAAGITDPGIRLLTRIADFVEPLTRFDRGHLTLESSHHVSVDVVARQVFRVSFETMKSEGNGGLPEGVTAVTDAGALARESEARLAAARAVMPTRLAAWAEAHGEDPLARPGVSDVFTPVEPIGHVETCAACAGDGKIACALCNAAGTLTCEACAGKGSTPCTTCSATGETACLTCKGMGTTLTEKKQKVFDDMIGAERVEHVQELTKCTACSGTGKTKCERCEGRANITCPTCRGQKTIPCTRCQGAGSEKCQTCGGEGKRHYLAQLGCGIRETFETAPRAADAEVTAVLKELVSIEQILELAGSHRATAETSADTLRRDTVAMTPVTTVTVRVGDRRAVIRGFGPRQEVRDYGNIAGMLLSDDLSTLEAILPATRLVPPKITEGLDEALSVVLASEVNITIAANATKKDMGGIERGLRGLVTNDYLQRAGAALKKAVGRRYWATMMAAPVCVLWGVLLIVPLDLLARGGGSGGRMMVLIGVMLLTFAAAVGAHYWVVGKMQKQILPNGAPKMGPIVDKLGVTRQWLIGAGVASVVLTMLVATFTSMLFPVAPPAAFVVPPASSSGPPA